MWGPATRSMTLITFMKPKLDQPSCFRPRISPPCALTLHPFCFAITGIPYQSAWVFGNRNSWLVKGLSTEGMLAYNDVNLVSNSRATKSNGNRVLLPVT